MRLKLQLRDERDNLLTEWIIQDGEDTSEINIDDEIDWLRQPFDESKSNAEALLNGEVYDDATH